MKNLLTLERTEMRQKMSGLNLRSLGPIVLGKDYVSPVKSNDVCNIGHHKSFMTL